jgi:hypothetical protein
MRLTGSFDAGQFALRLLTNAANARRLIEASSSPEQARQERDHESTPEQRPPDGHNGVRDHVRHPDQWIVGGFRCLIISHFRDAAGSVPLVHCRTVCAKTRMKRIVKTPMPTPMSTNSVPGAPSPARGRARLCGRVEWLIELDAIRWRTAPALVKSKTVIADLRKTATTYRTATANRISRRNHATHRKGRIKSVWWGIILAVDLNLGGIGADPVYRKVSVDRSTLRRKDLNAGAVAPDFKQCETKRILLGTEHATDKAFLVLCHPITAPVLGDLKMVRRRYRQGREARHAHSANPVNPMLFRAHRYIRRLPLGFETSLNALVLILHIDGHQPISAIGRERQVWTRAAPLRFFNTAHSRIFMRCRAIISRSDGLSLPWRLWACGSGLQSRFRVTLGRRCHSLKDARNIGEAEAIQRHLLRGEPVSWCDQGYAWVGQEAVGWFYAAAFLLVVLPYLVTRIKARVKDRSRLEVTAGGVPRPVVNGCPPAPKLSRSPPTL